VTFDIVLAVAVRSPAIEGETWPLTPSFHRSLEPGSGSLARTELEARSGTRRCHLHRGEHGQIARELEVDDELAFGALTLHAPPLRLEPGRVDVHEVVPRALLEPRAEGAAAVGGRPAG
jgi:hypothetical protein